MVADRMLGLTRLWAAVKYFHPSLGYKNIDWDAAYTTAVPKVQAARTKEDYERIVSEMLAAVGDPSARLDSDGDESRTLSELSDSKTGMQLRDDRVLVVTLRKYGDAASAGVLRRLPGEALKAKSIVLDLRDNGRAESEVPARLFAPKAFAVPGMRFRTYLGYRQPDETLAYNSYAAFAIRDGASVPARVSAIEKPVVLLVNRRSTLSPGHLGLQATRPTRSEWEYGCSMMSLWFHFGTGPMATITLKNVPDELYERLKRSAAENRRSMNSEAITCLEKMLRIPAVDPKAFLAEVRAMRRRMKGVWVTDESLNAAKRQGRA